MGYMHINNLYKDQRVLMFRECYALEKIHGTSAHVAWVDGAVRLSSGGEKHDRFATLFDTTVLAAAFSAVGHAAVTVYGEAYGGSQQAQKWRYGERLKFIAFEVQVGETWLSVPQAHDVASKLGFEFVHYAKVPTELSTLDAERDAPSEQAKRNGVDGDKPREGVVLRPLLEMRCSNGERVMAKHKRDDERETATPRPVVDPSKLSVLTQAADAANEWVTPTRLAHVLDKMPQDTSIEQMREVIAAMTADVLREGTGEIVDSREVRAAIGKRTAMLFKAKLQSSLRATG